MELSTDEEIINLTEQVKAKVTAGGLDNYIVETKEVSNPLLFIKLGFLPFILIDYEVNIVFGTQEIPLGIYYNFMLEAYLLDNYSPAEIRFWFGYGVSEILGLENYYKWIYGTIQYHKDKADKDANSLALLLYAPDQVYRGSKRPKTDMFLFRTPGATNNFDPQKNYLPVTRYAEGMSRGLFFGDLGNTFCGTFYYLERESKVFLGYKTSLTFPNKYQAALYLLAKTERSEFQDEKQLLRDPIRIPALSFLAEQSNLPLDLKLTPLEFYRLFPENYPEWSETEIATLPQIRRYIGVMIGYYANEDVWDQCICIIARRLGIDIVILERMIGSHQIVAEILDTRSRSQSFTNLVYT